MKTIVSVDPVKLYEHILDKTKDLENLSDKDAILCVLALEHLQNISQKNTVLSCVGGFVFGAISLGSVFTGLPVAMAAGLTTELFCINKAIKNIRKNRNYGSLQILLEMLLATRYENMMQAYFEISKLIQSIETEELIQFFKEGGAINE